MQCSCGRPLFDGEQSCDACKDGRRQRELRYAERHVTRPGAVDEKIRLREAQRSKGYDQ